MSDKLPIEEAATLMGCSVRTLQRRIASGAVASERIDGRTFVTVDKPTPVAVEALQRNLEATGQVATLAAVTGERAALAYQERAEELARRVVEERTSGRRWMTAALAAGGIGVASLVTLAATWAEAAATRDTMADMRTRLDGAEEARTRLEAALVAATSRDISANVVADEPGGGEVGVELAGPPSE